MCVSHPSSIISLSSSRPERDIQGAALFPIPRAIPTSNTQQIWLGRNGKPCSFGLVTPPDHKGIFFPYDSFSQNCPRCRLCCSRLDKPQPSFLKAACKG